MKFTVNTRRKFKNAFPNIYLKRALLMERHLKNTGFLSHLRMFLFHIHIVISTKSKLSQDGFISVLD